MRLKTFQAATMKEAMELVRTQLGPDAIIVATHEDESGRDVRITAAVESEDLELPPEQEPEALDIVDRLCEALDAHGTPTRLSDKLLAAAAHLAIEDPTLALAGALDECFSFAPLPDKRDTKPLMFIGPPGCGKTVGMAKLAVRTLLAGNPVNFVSTDTARAGAIEQLSTYARLLKAEFSSAADPVAFVKAVSNADSNAQLLIDTTGVNPLNPEDVKRLIEFKEAAAVELVLVMAAGGDAVETAEMAAAFAAFKPSRLLVMRLDMVRRLGSLLAAADASGLPFCDVSVTPDIASGLRAINPVSLARLLLPDIASAASNRSEKIQATGSK